MRCLGILSLAAAVSAGTVSIPFARSAPSKPHSITKRSSFSLDAINNITGAGYFAEFEVGTPGQKLSFHLDTGSSDTWVNSVDSDLCNSEEAQSKISTYCMTTFKPDDSSTFKLVDQGGFNITYIDGKNIQGDYFSDTVTIAGNSVTNQRLGLALDTVRATGLMGLGYQANVATKVKYPTIVDNMVSQGYINTPAFSLYLNDVDSSSGTILFGGIDKNKFIGNLSTLPLTNSFQNSASNVTAFSVMMKGFQVKVPSGKPDVEILSFNEVAVLDSGSTICLFPQNQLEAIYSDFDVHLVQTDDQGLDIPVIDCAYRGEKGKGYTFEFVFDGKNISVPMDEMVVDVFSDMQDQFSQDRRFRGFTASWESVCLFGIAPMLDHDYSNDFIVLGDTFLRSAYVVYDLANNQLGIAQASLNSTSSDIIELKAGDRAFPDVEGASGRSPATTSTGSNSGKTVTVTAGADSTAGSQSGSGDKNAAGHTSPNMAISLLAIAISVTLLVL